MAKRRSPFIRREFKCPACSSPHKQYTFRMRTFVPGKKESDQHVLEYKWLDADVDRVHPPYFFIYFCPSCFFADTTEDYEKPRENEYNVWVQKHFRNALRTNDPIIMLLGKRIDYEHIDFQEALTLHFLALYVQLLSPLDCQDSYKIARIYLRAAWLYREQAAPKEGVKPPPSTVELPAARTEIDESNEVISAAISAFERSLNVSREKWDKLSQTLVDGSKHHDESQPNPYAKGQEKVESLFETLNTEAYRLKSTFMHHAAGANDVEDTAQADSPSGATLDKAFVEKLKVLWPYAPLDEIEATRNAIRYFEKAVSADKRFDDPEAYYRTVSLAIDLMVRCDDLDAAFNMVRGIQANGLEARQRFTQALQEPELEPARKKAIQARMRRVNTSLSQAKDLETQLIDLIAQRDMPKISAVLKAHPKATPADIEQALEQAGIPKGIIAHLKGPGRALQSLLQ